MAIDILLASYQLPDRVSTSLSLESVHPLAGTGGFTARVPSSAVEVHFLPCGAGNTGIVLIQQRTHCEDDLEEVAAFDIASVAMSLRARGLVVIGGTDASLRPDKALKPVSPSSATPSIRSLLLVAPGLQAVGSSDSVAEAPAWCSPSAGTPAAKSLASLGIDIRSPSEAIAARSESSSIRRAAREAGQVRAGDTEAKELGVAGLAEATGWDAPSSLETAAAPSKGPPEIASLVTPHDLAVARASTEQVAPLFFGVDLCGQAHRIMRQAIALRATGGGAAVGSASTQTAEQGTAAELAAAPAPAAASGAAGPSPTAPAAPSPWIGTCALLRYAYEGSNLGDGMALASDLLAVAEAALAAADADGATGPASNSGEVKSGSDGGKPLRDWFVRDGLLQVPDALAKMARPADLSPVDARRVTLL